MSDQVVEVEAHFFISNTGEDRCSRLTPNYGLCAKPQRHAWHIRGGMVDQLRIEDKISKGHIKEDRVQGLVGETSTEHWRADPPCDDISMVPRAESVDKLVPPDTYPIRHDVSDPDVYPAHYGGGDNLHEHVKCATAWGLDSNAFLYLCTKYIARLGKKAGASRSTDLRKAAWYLQRAIEKEEKVR